MRFKRRPYVTINNARDDVEALDEGEKKKAQAFALRSIALLIAKAEIQRAKIR